MKDTEFIFEQLCERPLQYFGSEQAPKLKVVKKVWRPYSKVQRVRANYVNGQERFFWIKLFKIPAKILKSPQKYINRIRTEFEVTRRLSRAFADIPDLNVLQPLAFFPQRGAVLTWESPGIPVSEYIDRDMRLWPSEDKLVHVSQLMEKCGRALKHMQRETQQDVPFDAATLIEYVDIRLKRLVENRNAPFNEGQRSEVLSWLEREIPKVPVEHCLTCGVHSDYGPFNILATDDSVTLTDFTMYKPGSSYVDLTYFYHRLSGFLHKPVFRVETITALQDAFLRGYSEEDVREHALFQICLVRHTINNFSSLARNRLGGIGKLPMPHIRLFNRKIFRSYTRWLEDVCSA